MRSAPITSEPPWRLQFGCLAAQAGLRGLALRLRLLSCCSRDRLFRLQRPRDLPGRRNQNRELSKAWKSNLCLFRSLENAPSMDKRIALDRTVSAVRATRFVRLNAKVAGYLQRNDIRSDPFSATHRACHRNYRTPHRGLLQTAVSASPENCDGLGDWQLN